MILSEILEEIDLLIPNSFSIKQKIRWLNQGQKQLYRYFPNIYTYAPPDFMDDNLEDTPLFVGEYHELLVFAAAKRIAERIQKFDVAGELEVRYQNLLREAQQKIGPRLKTVQKTRQWR